MIDFLFDNFYVVIVVVFFLWSLFKPSKAEKQHKRPQPFPPLRDDEDEQSSPYESRELKREQQPIETTRPVAVPKVEKKALTTSVEEHASRKRETLTTSSSNELVQFDYAKEKQRIEERKKQAEEALKKIGTGLSGHVSDRKERAYSTSDDPFIKPNREQLREGILWAEILGKPRAKRSSYK